MNGRVARKKHLDAQGAAIRAPGSKKTTVSRLLPFRCAAIVVFLWFAIVAVSGAAYVSRFKIDNSVGIWFSETDPDLARYKEFGAAFGEFEWIFYVIRTKSIHDPEFKSALDAVICRIKALPEVTNVLAISSPDCGVRSQQAETVHPEKPEPKFSGPLFKTFFVRPNDDQRTALLLETSGSLFSKEPFRQRLLDQVDLILRGYPAIEKASRAGTPVINAELNRAALRDMRIFYVVLGALILLFGKLFLGNVRDLIVMLMVLAGSILPTLGLAAAMGLSFNLITIMLPTILVAMNSSLSVHAINEFQLLRRQMPASQAATCSVTAILRPAFWTSVTTVIGFLSLVQSDVVPIRQVGYLAAIGVGLGLINSLIIAPICLVFLWQRQTPSDSVTSLRAEHLAISLAGMAHRPRIVLSVAGAVFVVCLSGLSWLRADTDYVGFFGDGNRVSEDYRDIGLSGFPQDALSLEIITGPHLSIDNTALTAALTVLQEEIETLPGIRHVLSPAQSRLTTNIRGRHFSEYALRRTLAKPGFAHEQRTRMILFTDHMSSRQLAKLRRTVSDLCLHELPPGATGRLVGTNVLWANMDSSVTATQTRALAIIFVALIVLMPILTRSILVGTIGLLTSVLPVLSVLGLMGWFGITVNVATCLIGSVALGVAIDDTIFLLMRVRTQMLGGVSLDIALKRCLRVTGRAMVTTSLVVISCFLSMGLSDFIPTAQLGILFSTVIFAALSADLFLLPALLILIGWRLSPSAALPQLG